MLFNDVRLNHESEHTEKNSDGPWKTEGRRMGAGIGVEEREEQRCDCRHEAGAEWRMVGKEKENKRD